MKLIFLGALLASLATATLTANIVITVSNATPNGTASGGTGTGVGALTATLGSITSNRGTPTTTYTVSGVNLTSLGGTATESFTFTVSYNATTDGVTPGTPQFNAFGNVSVTGGDNNQIDGNETLSATIALASSSFSGLSLQGFTSLRAGGVSTTLDLEQGIFSWDGGSYTIRSNSLRTASINSTEDISSFTMSVSAGAMNFEAFDVAFVAIPEPSTYSMLASAMVLGLATTRRKRTSKPRL